MSYIINSTNPFVSIKLTETGRQQLALGQLTFSYWGIGDSEINYNREGIIDPSSVALSATSKVLRPVDKQPSIKSFITKTDNVAFNTIDSSNMNVIKATVNNAAEERGFFLNLGSGDYETLNGNDITPYTQTLSANKISGTTTLVLTTTSAITVGDIVRLKLANDVSGSAGATENAIPLPYLWYKVQSKTSTSVTLDRKLPNYSAQTATSEIIIYKGGEVYDTISTGNTTAYWDSGSLMFENSINVSCQDFPVWNMNNTWLENPAGITGTIYEDYTKFGSQPYLGTMNPYLEYVLSTSASTIASLNCNGSGFSYPDDINKSISILHFTNNTISNFYGEFFYIDTTNGKTLSIYMPDLMYHRADFSTGSGTTQGMNFVASGDVLTIGSSDIQYVELVEDSTMISTANTPKVVGKVFPQLKIVVIEDDELVAAMSYKSNRNWTLPELSAALASPSGGTSTGVLAVGQTMYLTYSLENTATTGLTTSMSCQKYVKITNNTSSAKDVSFAINETDLLPYMRKIELAGYDGLGFYANKFKLVYQIVSDPTVRPTSGAWKTYDFTSTAITGTLNQTINPLLLENQNYHITGFLLDILKDATATTFDITQSLTLAPNSSPSNLQFGDERFFYGNLATYIGATIFKTIFDVRISSSVYNTTSNPTRSKDLTTSPPPIKVSEVGIYDVNKNLVCIGKLSTPVVLNANEITLELSIDF